MIKWRKLLFNWLYAECLWLHINLEPFSSIKPNHYSLFKKYAYFVKACIYTSSTKLPVNVYNINISIDSMIIIVHYSL